MKKSKNFHGKRASHEKKSRKVIRKEKRDAKKQNRRDYYNRRQKTGQTLVPGTVELETKNRGLKPTMRQHVNVRQFRKSGSENEQKDWKQESSSDKQLNSTNMPNSQLKLNTTKVYVDPLVVRKLNEQAAHKELQKAMRETRNQQLSEANEEDEMLIKKLEKQLKLSKRKSKTLPKSFAADGLDYILDVCDSEKIRQVASIEKTFESPDSGFEEDLALITSKKNLITCNKEINSMVGQSGIWKQNVKSGDSYSSDTFDSEISDSESDEFLDSAKSEKFIENVNNVNCGQTYSQDVEYATSFENQRLLEEHFSDKVSEKIVLNDNGTGSLGKKRKMIYFKNEENDNDDENLSRNKCIENSCKKPSKKIKMSQEMKCARDVMYSSQSNKQKLNVTISADYEDINDNLALVENLSLEDGNLIGIGNKPENVIQNSSCNGAYVPPSLRTESACIDNLQQLSRLKRRVKGLLNRLSERNLCSISKEVSELYHDMGYSRNDMNTTLTSAIMESLVTPVLSLERLVMEHVALIAYLHYHEGSEVGAFILQIVVKKFDTLFKTNPDIENKELDNVILMMCFFYHFKVVHARLLFDILSCLTDKFGSKDVELILLMLRSVGFILRKDDPSRMKLLLIKLQELAISSLQKCKEPRIKFMLEVLVAVKNNNIARLPGWNPTPVDNMRKLLRSLPFHQNSISSELNISLKDILAADERGRWWVIGSSWVGQGPTESEQPTTTKASSYSAELLDLAEKMRMNTSIRRNVFCILMSSQDCNEAVANILQMGLKGIQAHEIIHVTLDCCLQEREYNQFYSFVLQNFCDRDRIFKVTLQRDIWSKFDDLSNLTQTQFTNMVKLLHQLLNQEVIDLCVFKVMDFTQLQNPAVRLLRQVLLGILSGDEQICSQIFSSITKNVKHKMFSQRLHLFFQKFILSRMAPDDPQKYILTHKVNNVFLTTYDL